MKEQSKEANEHMDQLLRSYYCYIGCHNVENIVKEQEKNKEQIATINVPKDMDEWLKKLLHKQKREDQYNKLKWGLKAFISKAAIFLLMLLETGTILVISVEGFRIQVLNIVLEKKEQFTSIEIKEEDEKADELVIKHWKDYYYPGYLPEGFKIVDADSINDTRLINFVNDKNQSILFTQAPNGTNFQLDTENGHIQEVIILREKGMFVEKDGRNILFWHNSEESFYIISEFSFNEMKKIAENLEKR